MGATSTSSQARPSLHAPWSRRWERHCGFMERIVEDCLRQRIAHDRETLDCALALYLPATRRRVKLAHRTDAGDLPVDGNRAGGMLAGSVVTRRPASPALAARCAGLRHASGAGTPHA